MTMGCPECGSLDETHKFGCRWEETHPTLGGIDQRGRYAVGTYKGRDFPQLHGRSAKLRPLAGHDDFSWVRATFIGDPIMIEPRSSWRCCDDNEFRRGGIYDATQGEFSFRLDDFNGVDVSLMDPDPLSGLARIIGQKNPFSDAGSRVDLDALALKLAGKNYQCSSCLSTDATLWRRCSRPDCPDGRDRSGVYYAGSLENVERPSQLLKDLVVGLSLALLMTWVAIIWWYLN